MTPLIDVVFLLLIFFICASTGHLREMLLPTDLAAGEIGTQAPRVSEPSLGEVRIKLRREFDQTVYQVEGREFRDVEPLREMLSLLAETAIEIPVILEIQGDVPLGDAVNVYDACRAEKFRSIHFAAKQGNARPK